MDGALKPGEHPTPSAFLPLTLLAALAASLALAMSLGSSPASAQGSAWWHLSSTAAPSFLPRHGEAQFVVTATDLGDGEVNATGAPLTLTDRLPPGVTPKEVLSVREGVKLFNCPAHPSQEFACTFNGTVAPYQPLSLRIIAEVQEPSQTPLFNVVKVTGGETPGPEPQELEPQELRQELRLERVPAETTPFGVEAYELAPETQTGSRDTQAGSHPFQLTTTLALNQTLESYGPGEGEGVWPSAPALPRNLHFKLPPGLLGDPGAVPECSSTDFSTEADGVNLCPQDTAVGVATVTGYDPKAKIFLFTDSFPVFNLQPAAGEPARFGFVDNTGAAVPVILKTAVPSGGEYGVEVSVEDASQAAQVLSSVVTLWGVPGDSSHDSSRGWGCLEHEANGPACEPSGESNPTAFLTLPTSCQAPTAATEATVSGESWSAPPVLGEQTFTDVGPTTPFPTLTGCGGLEFNPSLTVEPETHSASTPTGLDVGVQTPQPGLLAPKGEAEAAVRQVTLTLPPGLLGSSAVANALQACKASEFDFLDAFGRPFGEDGVPEELQTGNETFPSPFTPEAPACPQAAKLGTINIQTPLLPHELTGSLYLAAQNVNPFKSPLGLYLLAEDPAEGIRVKLAGSLELQAGTGQVIVTFAGIPQVPFTAVHVHEFGGERAALTTPPNCGPATTTSAFVPWSGAAATHPEPTFQITSGVDGSACPPSPLAFSPSFKAGPASPQAGAFSPELVDIGRPDGDQPLTGLSVTLPSGFAAVLASVTPCPEPPAGQEWACGEASRIGEAREYSGLGTEPLPLTGRAYLTTGYDGAPFGLLVRTLAQAGPFNLGWVNVRSRINVNPNTAAVTVTADPGPRGEDIPTILDGVPVQLKALEVAVNRPDFTFNPTSCAGMEFIGTLNGGEGAAFGVSDPFKAEGCGSLPFHPALEASTQGTASKLDGANLTVKVTSQGLGVANIAKVDLELPIALPSRLSTLQKACAQAVFEANPASCDEDATVGHAIVHTPVLRNPLTGPAILVSHGGAAFPDLEFILQGEGVKVILDGKTDIEKVDGFERTYSKFESAPDVPFTSFETVLPAGPDSILGASAPGSNPYDLCGANLEMPTVITGQNGAVIEEETKINATGCAAVKGFKTKKLTLAQQLAKALKKCRSTYKHNASKRGACERKAHATYTAKALAACRKSDKHSTKKRKACEVQARKTYAARKASRQ